MPEASNEVVIDRPIAEVFRGRRDHRVAAGHPDRLPGDAGPVRPEGRYTLSHADGGTRVRFDLSAKVGGLKRLMSSPVQKSMNAEVASLANLKQVLESDQAPGAR